MIIFALGFRPFFLLAGIFAVVLIGEWILAFVAGLGLANYYGAIGWHSHEMIFGFTGAVIAGFLLTAVRNWTEIPTAAGVRLAGLAALWCAGRVIPFTGGISQRWLIATVDLAFFPALAIALSVPLLRKKEKRNLIFLALLAGLFAANLLIHLEMNGYTRNTARAGIFLGLHLIVLLSGHGWSSDSLFHGTGAPGVCSKTKIADGMVLSSIRTGVSRYGTLAP